MNRSTMKLIGNKKNNRNCIEFMEWSNKMDLIALISDTGEVTINRFKWDMPIKIPPPEEKTSCK
ncbi:CLUMA_CG013605, isoform A [Clunio marinus]|uniref:CLUMA_CG013605, isoform A n=1 Tax=Clunio marinus TaxID=568069 RepID=A0A1J1IL96_9DIPT|nr:CLUMA_CG013605, isoform A [Clunio marinus]